jgi:non-heme chloroperoxidase
MAYVEAGKPGGPVVILLHGYTDTSRSFFPTIEALVQGGTDLHIYGLDLRGHGGSSMPAGESCAAAPEQCFGLANLAADVIAFMDQKNVQKAHIVAHSNGSLVAQELALTSPARVESLVLIGTWVYSVENPAVQQFLVPLVEGQWKDALAKRQGFKWPQDAYNLTPRDADPNVEAWIAQNWAVDPIASADFVKEIVRETAATKLGTWIGILRNIVKIDHRERLKQLTVPALVIWATQDNFFVESDQVAVRTALDAAVEACKTRYVFKTYGKAPLPASGAQESDLGHNTQWGAPQTMAADITAWVKTGKPTTDWPYADPSDARKASVDKGAAKLIEKSPAEGCAPAQ